MSNEKRITKESCHFLKLPVTRPTFAAFQLLVTFVVASFLGISSSLAAAPDLTSGGVPDNTVTFNLGATGMRGWVYHSRSSVGYSGDSRQILVTAVDAGSPADGVIATNDVILGASGTGANPVGFGSDARYSLALALADAEAQTPAVLKLLRWRGGATTVQQITLRTMGAYSATAPFNCPKSAKVLAEGLQEFFENGSSGRYTFGALSLLASGNPAYAARVRAEARAMVPSAAVIAEMKSNVRDTASTWERGHALIFLAEYYLATHDAFVLPTIEAYAVNIAKNQSLFGTVGHIYAEKNLDGSNNGPMGGVYGVVNSTGLPCFLALLLAKECGLTNPELDPAIDRTSTFFAYYSGKGTIPYGEHEPGISHESNGKSGLAAVAFALQANRASEQNFYTKMATASGSEREKGHTGAFFNFLWAPLGAGMGGEEAAAAHFSRISWHLDLARRWDGSFIYDCLNGEGPDSGSSYHTFQMSTAALLAYSLPLRELRITGRGHDPSRWLSTNEVTAAGVADVYAADSRSDSQLISDLGGWSPKVRKAAAVELGTRSISSAELNQITALANDPAGNSRLGACRALGEIGDSSSASTLAALLTDPDNHVRFMAADSLRYLSTSAKQSVLNQILIAADTTATPLLPLNEEDPLHFAHGKIAMLLFYSGRAYGPRGVIYNNIAGIDRNLLYPAIRAVALTPAGLARSTLSLTYKNLDYADTEALADSIVESIMVRAPADKMFSGGVRQGGIELLQTHGIAEGVPLSMIYMENDGRGSTRETALGVLEDYAASSNLVVPNPDVIAFCQALLTGGQAAEAQAVLDAIAADSNPAALMPLKNIDSITADAPSLSLPATSTILRVAATDLAGGDSVFTWRKVFGPGTVNFTPNGTSAAVDTTIQISPIAGNYRFEVTMSDSRGLTEVSETIDFTLNNSDGTLPPNIPPTAIPLAISMNQASPKLITLSGLDPEGFQLNYSVTSLPSHGVLTGIAPNLLFTPDLLFTGSDSFSFEVQDSEGQVDSATVNISVNSVVAFGVAIYEPFDYSAGSLDGQSGSSEVGLVGSWDARDTVEVVSSSLTYGSLLTKGGSIGNFPGSQNHYGGAREISASALADRGLLDDGSTLWFAAEVGYDTGASTTNARLCLALANDQFNSGNYNYWIDDDGAQLGSGLGFILGRVDGSNGKVIATEFRDSASGDALAGNVYGDFSGLTYSEGTHGLVIGRITWGGTPEGLDKIEIFQPGTDMQLPQNPISTLTTTVDQATFDTITFARGDKMVLDEIRFGPSYTSVLLGSVELAPTDYESWEASYPGMDLANEAADSDGDGLTNNEERIWGLHPGNPSSMHPLTMVSGMPLTYTRRSSAMTGMTYSVWYSTDLVNWYRDNGVVQNAGAVDANNVETVTVTLSSALLSGDELFIRIGAEE